jgi:hypothetical protein
MFVDFGREITKCTVILAGKSPNTYTVMYGVYIYGSGQLYMTYTLTSPYVHPHKQASYVPLRLSPKLCIVPEWSEPPDEPGVHNIILQPGVAFGTGA